MRRSGMIRIVVVTAMMAALGACSGGTQYSSQRAVQPQANYTPANPVLTEPVAVTPGASPVLTGASPVLTGPVAVTPGATPILSEPVAVTPGATPVLTGPVAITPGATPIDVTANAPAVSVKPQPRSGGQARVVQASAPVATAAPATPARAVRRSARGPIYTACKGSGRKAASSSRCGCVQWVADKELTKAQQRRGAGYFKNRQGLQDARQSDRGADEAFWDAWKAYGQSAARQCRGT